MATQGSPHEARATLGFDALSLRDSGEQVTVTGDWFPQPVKLTADGSGHWQVEIATGDAGGPHTITIAGKNTLSLEDVLFGEVWIGSGQSNMEMPRVKVSGAYTAIKDSARFERAEPDE